MKKNILKSIFSIGLCSILLTSCLKDLDRTPYYDSTSAALFSDFKNYKSIVAKIYGGLILTGQKGPDGNKDLFLDDEGFSSYLRNYFNMQEIATDEVKCIWGDKGIPDMSQCVWTPGNDVVNYMYTRLSFQIVQSNTFLREVTDTRLADRKIIGAEAEQAREFRNEVRFLRALSYAHGLDMFRNMPFATETSDINKNPTQATPLDLFNFIESELLDIEGKLKAPKTNEYGRVDQAAVWMLLSKLYLNAPVYIGVDKNTEVIKYTKKVIDAGYQLEKNYKHNFNADNHISSEIIFAVQADGINTQSYGGTNFIIHAQVNNNVTGTMVATDYGVGGGWGGLHATRQFVEKFNDVNGNLITADSRASFFTNGHNMDNTTFDVFTDGYGVTKFTNIKRNGMPGINLDHVDTDFPMFRLADAYLMYAEANLRNGGGSAADALKYVNELRERAYGNNSGNINASDLTLDFILDERCRELYWEGHRRTDLVRFDKFGGEKYNWAWKGGVFEGTQINSTRNIYPIPSLDLAANPNLKQNPGYN
jgi:starch-binding outer membrane protein, SusD/RagB family